MIQIYEEGIPIIGDYIEDKSIEIRHLSSMNEANGTVELIPSEPIRVKDDSTIGIYFPANSTKISFGRSQYQSCLYDKSSRPMKIFHIVLATRAMGYSPLIKLETSMYFQS